VKPVELAGATALQIDLKDRSSIDAVVGQIDGPVDALFSVAGLPGPPFSDLDTVIVNFIGARHLIDSLVPKMQSGSAVVCVASNAGLGWQQQLETLLPFVTLPDFDDHLKWCEGNAASIEAGMGYPFSKQALNAWVAWRAGALIKDGIRLNVVRPGPTQTPT